ncbi:hypothetical protein ES704_03449 [subsurface metagenome]
MDELKTNVRFTMRSLDLNTEIINNKYLLFVGAGASAPLGLKPTGPFLDMLPKKLDELIQQGYRKEFGQENIEKFLSHFYTQAAQHFGVTLPDSEIVLDYLDFLAEACRELDSLPREFRELAETGGGGDFHRRWNTMFLQIRSYIQKVVVEHYSRVDGEHASRIYKPLLQPLCGQGQTLPVFTTNYDWVFEHLAEVSQEDLYLEDGFESSPLGERWVRDVFDKFRPRQRKSNLVLFKLHGSTSWYRDEVPPQFIRKFPNPAPELAGSRAVLIYPTQVKVEVIQEEPFYTAYEYLRETMMHTNLAVIIGFSFRDPVINDTVRHVLTNNEGLKLAIIEPKMNDDPGVAFSELLDKLGIEEQEWKGRLRVIKGKFGDEPFVSEEVARTVQGLDQWDDLEPWVEGTTT